MLRRRQNRINILQIETGEKVNQKKEIKDLLYNHFRNRGEVRHTYEELSLPSIPSKITNMQNSKLIAAVIEKEIVKTITSLNPEKAPGPDGYHGFLFTEFWHIIKFEVINAVEQLYAHLAMPHNWNRTYIALIPKT